MRGGRKPVATGPEMVGLAGVGPADCQTVEHAVRDRRGRAQARRHPASNVGQRNRLPGRLRCQGHAATAIEACAVIEAGITKDEGWCCSQHVEKELRLEIRARGERPLAGPRNGECPLSLACFRPSGMRALDCLDSPVYEPDEEHATASALNAMERMDPAWRMQIATALMANAARNRSSEIRSAACLEKSQKSVAGS